MNKSGIARNRNPFALSGFAHAQWDADDGYYQGGDRAHRYGYQNGYRDGIKQGRHEGRENDPEDFRSPDNGQASRGYRDWMGPIWVYQSAYREGYRAGFRAGYNNESRPASTKSFAARGDHLLRRNRICGEPRLFHSPRQCYRCLRRRAIFEIRSALLRPSNGGPGEYRLAEFAPAMEL